jgi:hypothetical protein
MVGFRGQHDRIFGHYEIHGWCPRYVTLEADNEERAFKKWLAAVQRPAYVPATKCRLSTADRSDTIGRMRRMRRTNDNQRRNCVSCVARVASGGINGPEASQLCNPPFFNGLPGESPSLKTQSLLSGARNWHQISFFIVGQNADSHL